MRLLCVTRKYPPSVGGMEKFCYDLFGHFNKENDIDKEILALGKSQKHLIWFLPYCTLYLMLNARKWDVIFYGDSLLCGPAFFAKLVAPKTKAVVDVHGLDVIYPNRFYQLYLKLFYHCFDKYICNSTNTEQTLHERNITNTVVVNRGVDVNKFENIKLDKRLFRSSYNLPEDAFILLTVGRLVKRKGVEWFIRNVMSKLHEDNVYYMIVGGGEEESTILKAIKEHGLADKVKMMGRVSEEALDAMYVNSDAFVMPNIYIPNDRSHFFC